MIWATVSSQSCFCWLVVWWCPDLWYIHKMEEKKDMRSSSPARTPKLQLTAEQPSTGEFWIPPKRDTPHTRAKEKHQKDSSRGEITFRIKAHTCQRCSEGSNKALCKPEDPTETEPDLPLSVLSVSCRGMGQQWPAAGSGALGAANFWVWHKPSWRRSPLTPP